MSDQKKNAIIGIFVLSALAIIIYILLFLHPNVGDEGQMVRIRFANIDKVSVGTRVLFAGHPVGEVNKITEIANAREANNIRNGVVYIYELTIKIDTGIILYTTDSIAASTAGLLGEKSIFITPRAAPKGQELVRVTNQILYAEPTVSVEDAVKSFQELASKAQGVMDEVSQQLSTISEGKFWENLTASAENIQGITKALNRPEDLEKIVSNIKDFSSSGKTLFADAEQGKGTVGKLFASDDLYLRFVSLLSKGETVMDDINHYGLLFHTNKDWQRLRARRMNIMAKLCCPEEFRNFFTDEVNQISTSLSRVSMVLNQTDDCMSYWTNLCSPEFERVFAELLRRVEGLDDNIKLIDQQVIDQKERGCCK